MNRKYMRDLKRKTLISSSLSLVTYDDDIHSVEWTSYIISVAMMSYILIIVAVAMVRVLRSAIAILSQSPHHIHSRMRLAVCWYHHIAKSEQSK